MKKGLLIIFTSLLSLLSIGQDEIWMRPNLGQWHENIEYKIQTPAGELFLEENGFTYMFHDFGSHKDHHHGFGDEPSPEVQAHVVRTKFIGANPNPTFQEYNESPFYETINQNGFQN